MLSYHLKLVHVCHQDPKQEAMVLKQEINLLQKGLR